LEEGDKRSKRVELFLADAPKMQHVISDVLYFFQIFDEHFPIDGQP
jgi:hypothetical protein